MKPYRSRSLRRTSRVRSANSGVVGLFAPVVQSFPFDQRKPVSRIRVHILGKWCSGAVRFLSRRHERYDKNNHQKVKHACESFHRLASSAGATSYAARNRKRNWNEES